MPFHDIACRARYVRHDRFFLFQKRIEKRTLPDVWPTDNSCFDTFANDLAAVCAHKDPVDFFQPFSGFRKQFFLCDLFDILVFRIIDVDLDIGYHIQQFLNQRIQQFSDAAADSIHGQSCVFPGRCFDHIVDGFCLCQINTAIQESTLCKFPGFSQSGSL